MSADEDAETASVSPQTSCAKREDHPSDETSDPEPQKADTVKAPVTNDVATQSVLLALIAQPVVTADTSVSGQAASAEATTTAMESVMPPVKEDGTSAPVTAADSSNAPQKQNNTPLTQPNDPTTVTQVAVNIPPSLEITTPQAAQSQAEPISSPGLQHIHSEDRADPQIKPAFPLEQNGQPHDPVKAEAKPQPVALQNERAANEPEGREVVKTFTAEAIQRPEENRPLAVERPVIKQDAPEPKEEAAPRQVSVSPAAWQGSADQENDHEMNWTGRDHRERPSSDQAAALAALPEVSAAARPSAPVIPAHTIDQGSVSLSPSGKQPVEAPPASTVSTPSIRPTDWMPDNSASHTKSMVLELSQADLGRVSIRVAVNQDVVHTHLTSDRNEMGQYLQNGQDRLQSALQHSGLDLGRFQVDIDRQSAGRSFQQPASQGQSHGRAPEDDGRKHGQGREEFSREAAPRRGMLNLVA